MVVIGAIRGPARIGPIMMLNFYRTNAVNIEPAKRFCIGVAMATTAIAANPAAARDPQPLHDLLDLPDNVTVRGNVRARIEGIDGQFHPAGPNDDLFVSLRSDIFVEYDGGPIRIGGELRDARGYLQKRNSTAKVAEIDAFEPLQAYIALDLDGALGRGSTAAITAGRFTLDIGAQRLVAAPDFPNSIASFTGARFDWHSAGKDKLTLFWTMPSTRLPNDALGLRENRVELDRARSALQFAGGSFTKARIAAGLGGEAYIYNLAEGDSPDQPTRDRHLLTYGARLFRAPAVGKIDLEIEAARQTGRNRATTAETDRVDLPVTAGFVHAEIGRKMAGGWAPRVSLHGDYASGDDADPSRYARFDPLYGAPRVDFGPTALYGAVNRSNLISAGVRIDVVPSKRVDAFVMARDLWLATSTDTFGGTGVRDPRGQSGRHAGEQIEGRVRYWIVPKRLRIDGGGAYLAKGRFLRSAPNAPATGDTRYAYLDLSASF